MSTAPSTTTPVSAGTGRFTVVTRAMSGRGRYPPSTIARRNCHAPGHADVEGTGGTEPSEVKDQR